MASESDVDMVKWEQENAALVKEFGGYPGEFLGWLGERVYDALAEWMKGAGATKPVEATAAVALLDCLVILKMGEERTLRREMAPMMALIVAEVAPQAVRELEALRPGTWGGMRN